jgi:hypothetical protein
MRATNLLPDTKAEEDFADTGGYLLSGKVFISSPAFFGLYHCTISVTGVLRTWPEDVANTVIVYCPVAVPLGLPPPPVF